MPLIVSILATLATLQTYASLLPIAPKVSCLWDPGFPAPSPNRVITSSASVYGLRPNGPPRRGVRLLCANGGCSPRFARICHSQLSRQAGANCRAYHGPPSPAAPPLLGTAPLCEIKIRAARGKFPSGDAPGGFICLHLNTKRVLCLSLPRSWRVVSVPLAGCLGACAGV